ncbi:MAG: Gluconate 2-dehydrogenase cytochrome c subunit [Ignavibacteriaceae bacterium]|jgi:mono/diheme cytochrome c family protein|nr:MAG: diheme cytochrome c-553 [Chlorobiota bacterium]MBE7476059.1 diheme cytochrome c-553 [Ignavibacteriales bacterium]MBV6420970.1 Gluconate 2-dehydrogenase cytochrome c subunit [Ignavibacteriaceae bacterium]MCL4278125.1 diheme cytochrome c-553 [Ignavibacteriaceae bacterium]MCZ7614920.1 diheme cytochrome c-553 [Ignavibacteriaceae bacterium]
MHKKFLYAGVAVLLFSFLTFTGCKQDDMPKAKTHEEMVALGKYIVTTGGCEDCHSPKIYTEKGPEFDTTRSLSGFPANETLPDIDLNMVTPGKWVMTEKNFSAWVGPWGISYASNITPDKATGIGTLTEEMFIKSFREGKYMGVGRPLLPPMPWQVIGQKTDEDLKAIYAYLMSIKPVHNMVPQPTPPDKIMGMQTKK